MTALSLSCVFTTGSAAASEQCSGGATWRVFCYGIITAMIFVTLIALVTIVVLRPRCRDSNGCCSCCFPPKSQHADYRPHGSWCRRLVALYIG